MSEENQVMSAVNALRETVEKHGHDSAEFKAMAEKTEKAIADQEKKNQELVAKQAEADKKALDLEERQGELEKSLIDALRNGSESSGSYKESAEYKALNMFAKSGVQGLDMEQKSLLRSDNDTIGGYLIENEFQNEIIKKITEISPVRQVARVQRVGKKTIDMPTRLSIPTATYEGEAQAASESNSTYGSESLTCYRLTTFVRATADQLMDSNFDFESEVSQDVSEAFAFGEGRNFVLGDGAKKPEGFLVNSDVVSDARQTAASLTVGADDVALMQGDLKVGYNAMYAFNRRTLAYLRTLKGGDGQYLWQPGMSGSVQNQVWGAPYIIMNDMPDYNAGAGEIPIVYADFARGYRITDRTGMTVIRNIYEGDASNIVKWTFHAYNTGQVVLPEAFKALEIKS